MAGGIPAPFSQIITIPGGHGAAIKEDYWSNIAHFIVTGALKTPIPIDPKKRRLTINGALAVLLFVLLLVILYGIGWSIWHYCPIEVRVVGLMIYLVGLWKFLTKF